MKQSVFLALAVLTLAATPALAHTGAGAVSGLSVGIGHPIGGLDHVLAVVAVGILAARLGGEAMWFAPASFICMMIVGGLLAIDGVPVPFVELGILGSVVVLGGVIAAGRRMPVSVAMVLVGLMAVFHGHAHGTEMPSNAGSVEYVVGFVVATAMLHAVGIGLGVGAEKIAQGAGAFAVRASGGAIALAGALLFVA